MTKSRNKWEALFDDQCELYHNKEGVASNVL